MAEHHCLLRPPNLDVEAGNPELVAAPPAHNRLIITGAPPDKSASSSPMNTPRMRSRKNSAAPQPPVSIVPPPPPACPPPDSDPPSDNETRIAERKKTPPPIPPRTAASAIAVAKLRRPGRPKPLNLNAPLTPKPPRPNSQIIIPTDDDLKKNKKYYDMRMWKMGLDDMKNLKGDLLDHVQKVKEATTKSLSIGQRILLWLSDTSASASSKWFTHIALVLFLFSYAALGGFVFKTLEGSHEEVVKVDVEKARDEVLTELWTRANEARTIEEFKEKSALPLDVLQDEYNKAFNLGVTKGFGKRSWTFWGSVFYSGTIITTIGYGHIAPVTSLGRLATIIYAIFGIPILLMSLADFGKLFTRIVKAGIALFRRLYYTGTCRRARRTVPMKAVSKGFTKAGQVVSDIASFQAPDLKTVPDTPGTPNTADEPPPFEVDDEFDLPVSLAMFVLVLYLFIGGIIFQIFEGWSFLDSFYFVFVSMTTIGLGDIVPEHEKFMMALFVYLLFGLALTSMCINVVQESITSAFNDATVKLRAAIGMNLEAMEDDEFTDDEGLDEEKGDRRKKSKSAAPSGSRRPSKANVLEIASAGNGQDSVSSSKK